MADERAVPETETAYAAGYRAGWQAGFTDGKSAGYSDAKVRSRLAVEAACDQVDLPRAARDTLRRAAENIVGKVE